MSFMRGSGCRRLLQPLQQLKARVSGGSLVMGKDGKRGTDLSGIDPKRLAALGYCFGGRTVLDLARLVLRC